MPKKGYQSLTADDETIRYIDHIAETENCKTRPEALRLLIRDYKKKIKNVLDKILSHNDLKKGK